MAIVRVDNVRIMDLVQLLAQLSLRYDAVDIIVDDEEKRVLLDPIELDRENVTPPSSTFVLRDDNLKDII